MTPVLEVRNLGKNYGSIVALAGVSTSVHLATVTCVLGDNGAGKSTFIKILSGVHPHDAGELLIDGVPTRLGSPREARARGIVTVYQDLALVPLMAVWRNYVLGNEPTRGVGPFRRFDVRLARRAARAQLAAMGIDIPDPEQPVSRLSGGERQAVAIARALHVGARVIVLDEPTSALGVKQAGVVLRYIAQARDRGRAVILVTHNPHHAYLVGDRFLILNRGRSVGDYARADLTRDELARLMSGGTELEELSRDLDRPQLGSA
jgi:simple sugar transport system ATP-binding protein